ncbi:sugar phosphate isomerase/epimerase [Paenibacillus sp. N3.4]|uniref:sugar phosphate isomerase/epimerase family protein n=1 Tax=Paenibacillus sp. N3.4 TaxID=2603222 RepID=UPI0021C35F13|nr:sugar phosphate isomerase/epimerase family protein [Paenibacillus sp. N3.4]
MITGFADEISQELEEQLNVLEEEGIRYLELRGVWGTNVMKLSDSQLDLLEERLHTRGFRISSIASPLGKYGVLEDFAPQLDDMDKAIRIAKRFDVPYIRIFSYYIPQGDDLAIHRDEVMLRMKQLVSKAEAAQIHLVMENDSNLYGTSIQGCLDILQTIDSPYLRLAFDPGNFVINGEQPMAEAYPLLSSYIAYVHVKDARKEGPIFVPAGEGDSEFGSFLQALKQEGFKGFLSVEPHLHKAFPELSDKDRYLVALRALKAMLNQAGMDWN